MKKLLTVFLILMLVVASIGGCAKTEDENTDDSTLSDDKKADEGEWDFYNKRAEEFVTSMADGDFDAAVAMFDATMKNGVPASTLQNDVWNLVVAQAGEFVGVYEIENSLIDGYYICFTTSRHETRGVTLRIVFSKDGLVVGLYIDSYPTIAREIAQRNGFTDYPIVIGEGTDYPLNGILSMPDNVSGKVPAVVLVHGSGSSDMDETIYSNKPFRDIAEYLASNGIAVIRYDKRNFIHSAKMTQELGGSITVYEETVEDAVLAAEILKSDSRIDENKVFILGHSLGGKLAPRIHSQGGNFSGIISLAGSPRSLLDISYDQSMAYIDEMPEGDEKTTALSQMEEYSKQLDIWRSLSDDEAKNTPMSGGVSFYYYKDMEEHPVSEYVKDIDVPFLIMQGEKDFQVYADKDYTMWQELLADRANVTFKLYKDLNHLFMTSTGKNITEYQEEYKIENHIDNQVLSDIAEWIKAN